MADFPKKRAYLAPSRKPAIKSFDAVEGAALGVVGAHAREVLLPANPEVLGCRLRVLEPFDLGEALGSLVAWVEQLGPILLI